MDLREKKILLISPQSWGSSKVSKHHYALELARRGAKVFFISPPMVSRGRETFSLNREVVPRVHELLHEAPLRGLRFYPSFLRKALMKRQIRQLEKACAVESFDIVWSFEGSRFFDLSLFGSECLKIFHMVDQGQDNNLSIVAGTSDIVLCNTSFIQSVLRPYAQVLHKIPHGYAPSSQRGIKGQLRKGEGIQVAYLGNLSIPYIDRGLLAELPKRFEDLTFHLFGPIADQDLPFFNELGKRDNVILEGKVPAEEVRSCLEAMDLLLILYDAERFYKQVADSHKMMDYFASGKPVVATWMEEHREHRDLIRMVERQEDFIPAFEEVVENFEVWNAPELQERRKAIAESRTYDKLLDLILEKARKAKPSFFR